MSLWLSDCWTDGLKKQNEQSRLETKCQISAVMFLVSPDKWPLLYFYTHICKNSETLFFWKWKYCCDGIISVSNILVPHLTAHVLSSTVFPVGWSDTEHTYNKCQYSDCHIKAWELLSVSFHPCFIRSHIEFLHLCRGGQNEDVPSTQGLR